MSKTFLHVFQMVHADPPLPPKTTSTAEQAVCVGCSDMFGLFDSVEAFLMDCDAHNDGDDIDCICDVTMKDQDDRCEGNAPGHDLRANADGILKTDQARRMLHDGRLDDYVHDLRTIMREWMPEPQVVAPRSS